MSTLIHITRQNGTVTFETVSIPTTELVVWVNQDPGAAHWPSLSPNQLGAAPSPNSSNVPLPTPGPTTPYQLAYTCKIAGHENEKGTINVFSPFSAGSTTLPAAKQGQAIASATVATGGQSPYRINSQQFQVVNGANVQNGSGSPGPGLTLNATTNNAGLTVTGTPTAAGTYTFTFDATDAMGLNVQQTQFTMVVTA